MMLVMNEMMAMTATVAVATNACFSIILIFLNAYELTELIELASALVG